VQARIQLYLFALPIQFMRPSLMPRVQELLAEAEQSLGTRIELVEDSQLPVAGTTAVIPTRPNYGKIILNRRYSDCTNYVVANQCGHILRYARAPPEHRLVPTERPGAYAAICAEVDQHVRKSELLRRLPQSVFGELARMLTTGLVTQLTSMPVDCRIDRWLYGEIGEVRDEQENALGKMLGVYVQALKTADWTPRLIYHASNGMNAAFACNAAGLFPEFERYVRRFRREGFGDISGRLLSYLDGDEGHVSDVRTIDAWATELGVRELYEWIDTDEMRRCRRR
jgi:hypothetical protein